MDIPQIHHLLKGFQFKRLIILLFCGSSLQNIEIHLVKLHAVNFVIPGNDAHQNRCLGFAFPDSRRRVIYQVFRQKMLVQFVKWNFQELGKISQFVLIFHNGCRGAFSEPQHIEILRHRIYHDTQFEPKSIISLLCGD